MPNYLLYLYERQSNFRQAEHLCDEDDNDEDRAGQTTSKPNGFGIPNEDKVVVTAYQFQISEVRIWQGTWIFSRQCFDIVWLDPDHNLYR